jgi:hypothetical protein
MNNPYLREQLDELRRQEIRQEVEHARLLRAAGLAGEGLLARAIRVLRHLLPARKGGSQDPMKIEGKAYPSNESA